MYIHELTLRSNTHLSPVPLGVMDRNVVGSAGMTVWFSSKIEPQYGGERGVFWLHSKKFLELLRGEEFLGAMPLLYS